MLKIVKGPVQSYAEVSQVNPMRWKLCFKEKDGTLTPQSGWWKCKDFLNDVVVHLVTGNVFSIYGFNNKQKINTEGGYMALKNVSFLDDNLPILNEYLVGKGFPALELQEFECKDGETSHVLLIPAIYWKNTYYISYITALIRSCCFKKCKNMKEMVETEHYLQGGWFDKLDKLFDTKLTEKMNSLVYINYQYKGGKGGDYTSTHNIHNAGMQTWYNSKGQYGL